MPISRAMQQLMENASLIRRMFDEAEQIKRERGPDSVYDLSLGNPLLEPPTEFSAALEAAVHDKSAGTHRYMANAGYEETRAAVSKLVSAEQGVTLGAMHIIMSCGTAGATNVVLKAILDPGDGVIIFAPYFVEYPFYAQNHGGVAHVVESDDAFQPDIVKMEKAITANTKAVIINSPNNPTGVVYSARSVQLIAEAMTRASARVGHPIYLISDEVYRHIVYDGAEVPSVFQHYANSIIVTSFAKDLGLPGERTGYIALSPRLDPVGPMIAACTTATRVLGFINAPALMQRAIARCLNARVNLDTYERNRAVLCDALTRAGLAFVKPGGAFYLFPRCPTADDLGYCRRLKDKGLIAVPGSGFGRAGHFRLAYCVDRGTVDKAAAVLGEMK